MRVLLIQPPLEDFYTTAIRLYPLGLVYAAAVLRTLGVAVGILDCLNPLRKKHLPLPPEFRYLEPFLEQDPLLFKRFYRFGISDAATLRRIDAFAPDMVGISSQFTAYFSSVEKLASLIKLHSNVPVFIGGNHASVFADQIRLRAPQIDAVLTGPAESSLPAFIYSRLRGRGADPEPLDWKTLAPAHDLLAAGAYRMGKKNYMSLTAGRGCPYGCDFCSVRAMFGRGIEYRSVAAVVREMEWNYLNRDVRIFNFEDDNLSFDKEWFRQLLGAVIDNPILKEIELTAMNGMCFPTLDSALLMLMRRAGFTRINLSFVTRDAGLQQRYHRPMPRGDFRSIITAARELGFMITVYVIIGLPGQTYAEVKESIDYLLELGVLVGPSPFYLPPGSALFDTLNVPDKIRLNWNLYRSTAFAVETEHLRRDQLIELFSYTRKKNLENRLPREPAVQGI
ncbi:MAG: radical SAM protein [Desulfobacterales bacterium]|nr:radical SAM protein [Desulfobacterales bacterium]